LAGENYQNLNKAAIEMIIRRNSYQMRLGGKHG
jgi:hypothetical protein